MELKSAKEIIDDYSDSPEDYESQEIHTDEPEKLEDVIVALGGDTFWLPVPCDSRVYGLETDWATCECIICPSEGNHRTVIYL